MHRALFLNCPTLRLSYGIPLALALIFFVGGCASVSSNLKRSTPKIIKSSGIKARVVIDPGHGGEDPGAVGRKGLMEKDITLDIAKRVARLFAELEPGVEIILTRTSDRYVSLEDRVTIANAKKGHVFISLHINSSESKEARGFEIYSLDVASDRHAERLAARENKEFKQKNSGADLILADLRAFSHRKDSDRLAGYLAQGLRSQLKKQISPTNINDRGYNQAIFHVLFVKMPAVLTELFFVSNPTEEKMLSNKATREHIARGVFLGVKKFISSGGKHASR
jgi:N-acetylmuramoyl-L-alanine amidase